MTRHARLVGGRWAALARPSRCPGRPSRQPRIPEPRSGLCSGENWLHHAALQRCVAGKGSEANLSRTISVTNRMILSLGLLLSAEVFASSTADARGCRNTATTCSDALVQCERINAVDGPSGTARCGPIYLQCMRDGSWIGRTCNRTGLRRV